MTDKSITAHLDLNVVHDHRYHGVYDCTTNASLIDKPESIYVDTKTLRIHAKKKQTGNQYNFTNTCTLLLKNSMLFLESVLAFSVQSSTDQSSSGTSTAETVYIVAGVTVFVVATALLALVIFQRLRSRKNSLLNEQQHV